MTDNPRSPMHREAEAAEDDFYPVSRMENYRQIRLVDEEGRVSWSKAGRRVWYVDPSQLLKMREIEITVGPFQSTTHVVARYGWGVKIEQNIISKTVRVLFTNSDVDGSRIHYSVKWNQQSILLDINEAWRMFAIVSLNPCRQDKRRDNLEMNPRAIFVSKPGERDLLRSVILQSGEQKVLETMNDMALERLGDWRPSGHTPEAIEEMLPNLSEDEEWMRNWRPEDEE
jgi:hypothetical protein